MTGYLGWPITRRGAEGWGELLADSRKVQVRSRTKRDRPEVWRSFDCVAAHPRLPRKTYRESSPCRGLSLLKAGMRCKAAATPSQDDPRSWSATQIFGLATDSEWACFVERIL